MKEKYADYIRETTNDEMAIFNKVENALDEKELETLFDLVCDEPMSNLLKGEIENKQILAMIADKGLTATDVCTWYFID